MLKLIQTYRSNFITKGGESHPYFFYMTFKEEIELQLRDNKMVSLELLTELQNKNYFSGKEFEKYPFWIAHYQTLDLNEKTTTWNFWQHNEKGKVNGIRGGVDFNVFKGNYDDLLGLCKK